MEVSMATAGKAKSASKPRAKKADKPLVCYKGFTSALQCQGYQFEVGKSFTHDGPVKACASGFHACEAPFDVWSYYGFGTGNRFCRVHLTGKTDRHEGDSKVAAETIFIESEITLGEMIRAGVKHEIDTAFAKAKVDDGNSARNASSGNYATNASSGDSATNASSGDSATNASSGDSARNEATGKQSVIAAAGLNSTAKGAAGTAIALPYKDKKGQIRFACGVAGEDCPADTRLIAKDGKLIPTPERR
jgi:hypothetical protein